MNITENLTGRAPEEIFSLAARENNTKRGGLIVNHLQAKHVPAKPSQTLDLFDRLADRIPADDRKTMVIGFAETATAIGARIASRLGGNCIYIHTTREKFPKEMNIALFCEEHSHATEQQLMSDKGLKIFDGVERVIFAEDELTTGKTILNFINALKGLISCEFGAASIINGMSDENLAHYNELGVKLYWLIKTDSSADTLKQGITAVPEKDNCPEMRKLSADDIIKAPEGNDPRLGLSAEDYDRYCHSTAEFIFNSIRDRLSGNSIDFIGTEECMYPAIITAEYFEKMGFDVRCHSTTRSPVVPSAQENYPLFSRYRLSSFYDRDRQTFLYNLYPCSNAVVITDGNAEENELYSALTAERIMAVQL